MSRLIYFLETEVSEIKTLGERSCHITLMNVISVTFYARCLHYNSLYYRVGSYLFKMGCITLEAPHTPSWYFSRYSNQVGQASQKKIC